MLKDFVQSIINEQFKHTPTKSQEMVIGRIAEYINHQKDTDIFILKGYAGTGKTSLINAIVRTLDQLKIKTILMAPTGRAAKILAGYCKRSTYTIHKKIYRQKSSDDGFGRFVLDKNLHSNTLFIVDEASMISNSTSEKSIFGSGRLLDDLLNYVFNDKNCKLLLVGDTAQLPPVGIDLSPALDKKMIASYGKSVTDAYLTDVVRQVKESGILHNATMLRELIQTFSREYCFPKFRLGGFTDIRYISGEDLIEEINTAYSTYSMEETIVITRSNKRANRYNQGIRNAILWREDEIATGDLLMVVKNNYFWMPESSEVDFIANGDIIEITAIHGYEDRYDYRFVDVSIRLLDYNDIEVDVKIILDTLTVDSASLTYDDNRKFFFAVAEDYSNITSKKKRYNKVKDDPYFNALQIKFAYAVTCHKAQGGQWKAIFVDQGYFTDDMLHTEYLRWLYTAVTRATEMLCMVNFKRRFFEKELED